MAHLLTDLRIAWSNLLDHRRRSALLGGAIASVTCLFVLLMSLSLGVRQSMIDTASTLTTGHINVAGLYKITAGEAVPIIVEHDNLLRVVRQSVPEAESVVQRGRGMAKLVSVTGSSTAASLVGVDIATESDLRKVLDLVSGSADELSEPNTLLIFEGTAKKLGVRAGDALTLVAFASGGATNTLDCRVAAIAHDIGLFSGFTVFTSNSAVRSLYQLRPDVMGALQIRVKRGSESHLDASVGRLRDALSAAGYKLLEPEAQPFFVKWQNVTREDWTGQRLDVSTWQDELSFMMWTVQALQGFSVLLLFILVVIMMAGILNSMWVAVRERTREIGTLRAIGMQRGGVARLFLLEATLLGLVGAATGVVGAVLVMLAVNAAEISLPLTVQFFLMRRTLQLSVDPLTLPLAVGFIMVVTGLAAVYPSLIASRRKPVEAMAHFG